MLSARNLTLRRGPQPLIEARLTTVTAERAQIEAALGEASATRETIAQLADRHADLTHDLEALEAQWLEIGIAIEADA